MIEERASANLDELPKLTVNLSKLFEQVTIGLNHDPKKLLEEPYRKDAG